LYRSHIEFDGYLPSPLAVGKHPSNPKKISWDLRSRLATLGFELRTLLFSSDHPSPVENQRIQNRESRITIAYPVSTQNPEF
jgi:hypothetical protein